MSRDLSGLFDLHKYFSTIEDSCSIFNINGEEMINVGRQQAAHIGIQFDDEMKYIDTNKNMETNVPGVFAAGEICGPPWQMAKAVGEGCVAGIAAATYAKKTRKSE